MWTCNREREWVTVIVNGNVALGFRTVWPMWPKLYTEWGPTFSTQYHQWNVTQGIFSYRCTLSLGTIRAVSVQWCRPDGNHSGSMSQRQTGCLGHNSPWHYGTILQVSGSKESWFSGSHCRRQEGVKYQFLQQSYTFIPLWLTPLVLEHLAASPWILFKNLGGEWRSTCFLFQRLSATLQGEMHLLCWAPYPSNFIM